MKKNISIVVLIISIILGLVSCQNPIVKKRKPCSQPNTKWVSEDNTIFFEVDKNYVAIGQMNVYGETVEFYLVNDMGTGTRLYSLNVLETNTTTPEDEYEYWLCSYKSEKKFVATVERTTFFNVGDKITFKRQ